MDHVEFCYKKHTAMLHVASVLNDDICGENGSLVLSSGAEYKLIFYA